MADSTRLAARASRGGVKRGSEHAADADSPSLGGASFRLLVVARARLA
jgi:hypothetical protein